MMLRWSECGFLMLCSRDCFCDGKGEVGVSVALSCGVGVSVTLLCDVRVCRALLRGVEVSVALSCGVGVSMAF